MKIKDFNKIKNPEMVQNNKEKLNKNLAKSWIQFQNFPKSDNGSYHSIALSSDNTMASDNTQLSDNKQDSI